MHAVALTGSDGYDPQMPAFLFWLLGATGAQNLKPSGGG
jgi:hypothetical protein